ARIGTSRYGRSKPPMFNPAKFGAGCFWVLNPTFSSQDLSIPVLICKCRVEKIPESCNFPRLSFEGLTK
ncbi:MAG: hypothetical protein Q8R13_05515, partial [bacterium]|nr:hypothetical protein [bacterium]